ncbi:MAG TPA: PQQ-binding-like beta-propeller repeat protein [Vicinamibacterales bacterium]|nr:PQQ-binding-like beta-propeller repeat protein [Vicinamibacterales bacterium]
MTRLVVAALLALAQWPQFRGPDGNGVSTATGVPVTWSETENVRWKTPIHGRAWSSPVVLGRQVWLTTATPDGKELYAIAIDKETGKIVHDLKLFDVETPQFAHSFNTYASPTPVIEPGRIYVTFGSPGTAAIDTATGKVLWERRDLECNHFRGAGSSPIVFQNLLLMHFDGSDVQYVVALDKRTGKTVWKTDRSVDFQDIQPNGKPKADGDFRKAFATPQIVMAGGRPVMVSLGSMAAYGYDPLTGKELWRVVERANFSMSTRPVVADGLVYYPTGFNTAQIFAVRPDGSGDVTSTHVTWKAPRGAPNKPSILFLDGLIYMVNDGGVLTCLDAKTGEEVWKNRLTDSYSASPIAAGGRIYFFSEDGRATVIEAGREFKKVAENMLSDGFMASPAVDGKALYLRTKSHLYRVEAR